MDEITDHLRTVVSSLFSKYPTGSFFDDPVSMLQRNLRIGYSCALVLADILEKQGVWTPLVNGVRFLNPDFRMKLAEAGFVWNGDSDECDFI